MFGLLGGLARLASLLFDAYMVYDAAKGLSGLAKGVRSLQKVRALKNMKPVMRLGQIRELRQLGIPKESIRNPRRLFTQPLREHAFGFLFAPQALTSIGSDILGGQNTELAQMNGDLTDADAQYLASLAAAASRGQGFGPGGGMGYGAITGTGRGLGLGLGVGPGQNPQLAQLNQIANMFR